MISEKSNTIQKLPRCPVGVATKDKDGIMSFKSLSVTISEEKNMETECCDNKHLFGNHEKHSEEIPYVDRNKICKKFQDGTNMALFCSSSDKQNFQCITNASVDFIQEPLRDILSNFIAPENLYDKIISTKLYDTFKLRPEQLKVCFRQPPVIPDYSTFDVTLLYILIRNLCPSLRPTKGWGKEPDVTDTQLGDDIERLRLFRNKNYAHANSTAIPDTEFDEIWGNLKSVVSRIQSQTKSSVDYKHELTKIEDHRGETIFLKRAHCKELELFLKGEDGVVCNGFVGFKEPRLTLKGENEVICGGTVRFNADVNHADSLHCNWQLSWVKVKKNGIDFIDLSKGKHSGSTDKMLVIQSVCKEDEGEYRIDLSRTINGNQYKVLSDVIYLRVLGELPVLKYLDVRPGDKGITIHYRYSVTHQSPKVKYIEWRKNGELLETNNERFTGGSINDKTLTIMRPTEDDRGKYSCIVTNAVGPVSMDVTLDIPSVQIDKDLNVVFGSKATIKGDILSTPSSEAVEWQKSEDGENFDIIDIKDSKYIGSNIFPLSPLLVISKAAFDDKRFYRLKVWNKIGSTVSDNVYINVTGSVPNVKTNKRTRRNKNSVELTAETFLFPGSPDISDVFWTKNEKIIATQSSDGRLTFGDKDNPSLIIRDVNRDDFGVYELTVINAIGSTTSDAVILGVPRVLWERIENKENGSHIFKVTIDSFPTPFDIFWSRKGRDNDKFTPIDVNTKKYKGSSIALPHPLLVINQTNDLENNSFQIEVKNFIGNTVEVVHDCQTIFGHTKEDKESQPQSEKNWLDNTRKESVMAKSNIFSTSPEAYRKPATRKTAPAYPFSKATLPKDVLTSVLKARVSKSVGLIYIDGQPYGTGFRVGCKHIMTCAHVVTKVIKAAPHFIECTRVYIEFEKIENREYPDKKFYFQPTIAYVDAEFDVAVLELKQNCHNVSFPPPLTHFCEISESEIHLIGHPGGKQMKEDSDVTPKWLPDHSEIGEYIAELSRWSVNYLPGGVDYYSVLKELPRKIMFHTTFDKGSSGSPGFMIKNEQLYVVLMMCAGTPKCFYEGSLVRVENDQKIEFGYAICDIYKKMQISTNDSERKLASDIFPLWAQS